MDRFIFSTITTPVKYTLWKTLQGLAVPGESVTIAGGANVANDHLVTPKGVCTRVTDAEYAILEKCPAFARHKKAGYLLVEDYDYAVDEVAPDMTPKDGAAPATPKDFEDEGITAPSTGEAKDDDDKGTGFQGSIPSRMNAPSSADNDADQGATAEGADASSDEGATAEDEKPQAATKPKTKPKTTRRRRARGANAES